MVPASAAAAGVEPGLGRAALMASAAAVGVVVEGGRVPAVLWHAVTQLTNLGHIQTASLLQAASEAPTNGCTTAGV